MDNVNAVANIPAHETVARDAWRVLRVKKALFSTDQYTYVKCLGYGGMGLALHFKYESRRPTSTRSFHVVIKVSLNAAGDKYIRKETRATMVS